MQARDGLAGERPRVAIFQAHWRLHSNTVFAALALAEAGYRVDLFLYKVDLSLPTTMLERSPNILIHSFEPEMLRAGGGGPAPAAERPWLLRMTRKMGSRGVLAAKKLLGLGLLRLGSDIGLIPRSVIRSATDVVRTGPYRAFIGIEKGGLIWAAAVARRQPSPLIYLNLELFTSDVWSTWGLWHRRMKAAENRAHQRCWATIIQDETRGRILLKDNQIPCDMKMLYVPISRVGGRHADKSRWLQTTLGLPDSSVVILNHGMIAEDRHTTALARVAQSFDNDWILVFHGWGWNVNEVIQSASRIDVKKKVRFSLKLVDLAEESSIPASAHITLVLYNKTNINDQL